MCTPAVVRQTSVDVASVFISVCATDLPRWMTCDYRQQSRPLFILNIVFDQFVASAKLRAMGIDCLGSHRSVLFEYRIISIGAVEQLSVLLCLSHSHEVVTTETTRQWLQPK